MGWVTYFPIHFYFHVYVSMCGYMCSCLQWYPCTYAFLCVLACASQRLIWIAFLEGSPHCLWKQGLSPGPGAQRVWLARKTERLSCLYLFSSYRSVLLRLYAVLGIELGSSRLQTQRVTYWDSSSTPPCVFTLSWIHCSCRRLLSNIQSSHCESDLGLCPNKTPP